MKSSSGLGRAKFMGVLPIVVPIKDRTLSHAT